MLFWNQTHGAKEAGECFGVNTSTVCRLEKRMRETGSVESRVSQRGRKSALSQTDLQNIDQMIRAQPDIMIQEIRKRLKLPASDETVRRAAAGWTDGSYCLPGRDDRKTFCRVCEGDFAPKPIQR